MINNIGYAEQILNNTFLDSIYEPVGGKREGRGRGGREGGREVGREGGREGVSE